MGHNIEGCNAPIATTDCGFEYQSKGAEVGTGCRGGTIDAAIFLGLLDQTNTTLTPAELYAVLCAYPELSSFPSKLAELTRCNKGLLSLLMADLVAAGAIENYGGATYIRTGGEA